MHFLTLANASKQVKEDFAKLQNLVKETEEELKSLWSKYVLK